MLYFLVLVFNVFALHNDTHPITAENSTTRNPMAILFNEFKALDGPLHSCGNAEDLLALSKVLITPYPLKVGQPFVITFKDIWNKDITQGASIKVGLKWGMVTLYEKMKSLCKLTKMPGSLCPIAAVPREIQFTSNIPRKLPGKSLGVHVVATDSNGSEIACISGAIRISE